MGEANVAMARADRKVPLVARPQPIARIRGRQLALVTSFEPGPATLCALAMGPRQSVAADRQPHGDPGFWAAGGACRSRTAKSRLRVDVRDWLTAYARAGGPHHHALCFGDARPRLKLAAALSDADYCEV